MNSMRTKKGASKHWFRRFSLLSVTALALLFQGCTWGVVAAIIVANQGSSGDTIIINNDTGDLVISRGNRDLGPTNEGVGQSVVVFQFRSTATIDLTLRSLGIEGSGTGDFSKVSSVALHLDRNADGQVGQGDTQLGTATFDSDMKAQFTGLNFAFAKGQTEHFVIVLGIPSDANEGDSFAIEINDPGTIDARQVVNGFEQAAQVFGLPVEGALKTVSGTGSLTVLRGPVTRDTTIAFPGGQDAAILQLDLRTSSVETLQLQSLTLKTSGSGNEAFDVLGANLYVDVDSDGKLDLAIDRPLRLNVTAVSDNNDLIFNSLAEDLAPGSITRLLVLYNFANTLTTPSTFTVELNDNSDIVAMGQSSNVAADINGAPVLGTQYTIRAVPVSQAGVTASAQPLLPQPFVPNQSRAPVLRLNLEETGGEAVIVRELTVNSAGTGSETQGLLAAQLWNDLDNSGTVSVGDVRLDTEEYTADDGRLTFTDVNVTMERFTTINLLVTFDTAPGATILPSDTFRARVNVGDILIQDADQDDTIIPVGLPVTGDQLIVPPLAEIQLSQNAVATTELGPNLTDVPVLSFLSQEVGNDPALLKTVTITAAGTGQDATDITNVRLYLDSDASATVSMGDTLLGISFYNADDGTATFDGLSLVIPANGQANFLVTYNTADKNLVTISESFQAILASGALVFESATDGRAVAVNGLPQSGATVLVPGPEVVLGAGTNNPTGTISTDNDATGVVAAQATLTALPLDDVTVTSVTATVMGSANDANDIASARLILDTDNDGAVDGGDMVLATMANPFPTDDSSVTFTGFNQLIPIGQSASFLIVYDFSGGSQATVDVTTVITINDIAVATPAVVSGLTVTGASIQLLPQTIVQAASGGVIMGIFGADQANAPLLRLRLNETGGADARLTSLNVTGFGTGDFQADINIARLWIDADGNGQVNDGDTNIGAAGFLTGNVLTFGSLNANIPALGFTDFLVTFDTKGAAEVDVGTSFQVFATGATIERFADSRPGMISGFPIAGPSRTVPTPQLNFQVGANSPGAINIPIDGKDIVALQVQVSSAADRNITFDSLRVTASGSLDDRNGVVLAKLYSDADGDGEIDGTPGLIQTLPTPFTADDGVVTFSNLGITVPSGVTRNFLVAFDFAGAAAVNETFQATVANEADLGVTAPSQVVGTVPVMGQAMNFVGSANIRALNAEDAAGQAVNEGNIDVAVLYAEINASDAEDLNLTDFSVTGMGIVDFATSFMAVKLYLDNGDDAFDPGQGDALLSTLISPFSTGRRASFTGLSQTITAGSRIRLWVAVDMSTALDTAKSFQFAIAGPEDVVAPGAVSGAGESFLVGSGQGQVFQTQLNNNIFSGPLTVTLSQTQEFVQDIVTADFDCDGRQDFVALLGNDLIELRLNQGGFVPGPNTGVYGTADGLGGFNMAVGDLNRDGYPDLVLALPDKVRAFINAGATTPGDLSNFIDIPSNATDFLSHVELIDVNRDGRLDIVTLADNFGFGDSGRVRIHINNNGQFGPALTPFTNLGDEPGLGVSSDFDGDGKTDFAFVGNNSTEINTLGGDGVTFNLLDRDIGNNGLGQTGEMLIAKVDFNRDSHPDLLILQPDSGAYFLARSTRQAGNYVDLLNQSFSAIDGDGFKGNGPIIIDGPSPQKRLDTVRIGIDTVRFRMRAQALATGDWNGDGVPDYAFGFSGGMGSEEEFEFGGVITHLGKGDGGTAAVDIPRFQQAFDVTKLVAADLNNDNDSDLIFATQDPGEVQILFGDGENGSRRVDFQDPVQVPFGRAPLDVATGDFDRDGDIDFAQVTSQNGNSLSVWLNNGVGRSYKKLGNIPLSGRPLRVISADGNRDGALDLYVLLAGESGTVGRIAYFEGQRDGTFALRKETVTSGLADDLGELKFADFDRDGDLDAIATIPTANVLQIYRNQNGLLLDGTAADRLSVAADPIAFEILDFSKDARLDLIVLGRGSQTLQSFQGDPSGSFTSTATLVLDTAFGTPGSMSIGDVFADGSREVVISASSAGNLGAFTVANDGSFTDQGTLALPGTLERIQLADLNRDGVTELVGTTQMGGLVVLFDTSTSNQGSNPLPPGGSMNTARFTAGGSLPGTGGFVQTFFQPIAPSANPIRFVLSDVDGDGDLDAVIASEGGNSAQINIGR